MVTAFTFRLHPVDTIVGRPMLWPVEQAAELLRWYRAFLPSAPEALIGFFAFHIVPPAPPFPEELRLQRMCGVVWCWTGPAGLATAAELHARDVLATVLERGPQPGAALTGRYDTLRFNTFRRHSALPGTPFPRKYGRLPARDQYIAYLQRYAADRDLAVETGVEDSRIRPDSGWCVSTSAGERHAEHVVVATGALK
ncbi:NAD(P)-binding domain-containing protein [Kocuria sp. UCD-OTCP]|uniref:NAD(P)-binding domain-containing protein n=1 Tax=Kocuria sp. UCD-OTCP TaxID=1292021 RepID=UPI0003663311|nr:NAD(P)-binding domain-containing protein [Kocuria sp. UCD-OTCP]EYT54043.1 hypothetical protein H488_0104950 [Kocuria sp. UCD-OTCP]